MASEAALFTYEADALTLERRPPDAVVLPRSTDEVCALVRWARAKGVPVTPRGAGTGLSGGATTEQGGLSLSLNRMDQVLRVDDQRMLAWVQPGLVNLWLSQQLAARKLYFAPDPASQQVSTIGGNVATNAGEQHARSERIAKDADERALLWKGRKSAFGAYGRAASGFTIMDGVVPRTRLAEALSNVYRFAAEKGLEAGNVFHAGDGNLH